MAVAIPEESQKLAHLLDYLQGKLAFKVTVVITIWAKIVSKTAYQYIAFSSVD